MATAAIRADSALIKLPPVLSYIMGVPVAPRDAVERTLARAIDALDELDGDPDLELNGDELDGNGAEDDFGEHQCNTGVYGGPGCPIADPDIGTDDEGEAIDEREPDEHEHAHLAFPVDQSKGPLPPHLSEDRSLRRPFVERARREHCRRLPYADVAGRTYRFEGR